MKRIVIGSRGSQLALTQTQSIIQTLQTLHADLPIELRTIKTSGDRITDTPLSRFTGDRKGLFVKEIEEALLDGQIDLAVHSLKDLPSVQPAGLLLGAFPRREDPRDAFIARTPMAGLSELPPQARVGTGSLRRKVQLLHLRPDLSIEDIRGNVDTRLRKLEQQQFDGIVLAQAGLNRMGLSFRPAFIFSTDELVPAVGQGALALEIRENDPAISRLLEPLDNPETRQCVMAERQFLQDMGGGCQVPMGGFASLDGEKLHFHAFVADPSSGRFLRFSGMEAVSNSPDLIQEAVDSLNRQGAKEILEAIHTGT